MKKPKHPAQTAPAARRNENIDAKVALLWGRASADPLWPQLVAALRESAVAASRESKEPLRELGWRECADFIASELMSWPAASGQASTASGEHSREPDFD